MGHVFGSQGKAPDFLLLFALRLGTLSATDQMDQMKWHSNRLYNISEN